MATGWGHFMLRERLSETLEHLAVIVLKAVVRLMKYTIVCIKFLTREASRTASRSQRRVNVSHPSQPLVATRHCHRDLTTKVFV